MPSISRCFFGGTALCASHPSVSRSGNGFLGAICRLVNDSNLVNKALKITTPHKQCTRSRTTQHGAQAGGCTTVDVLMLTPARGRPIAKTSLSHRHTCTRYTAGASLFTHWHISKVASRARERTSQRRGVVMMASTVEESNGTAPCAWYHEVLREGYIALQGIALQGIQCHVQGLGFGLVIIDQGAV